MQLLLQPENSVPEWPQTEHLAGIADEQVHLQRLLRPAARLRLQAIKALEGAGISSPLQNDELRCSEQGAPSADISESRPRYHFLSLRFSCSP